MKRTLSSAGLVVIPNAIFSEEFDLSWTARGILAYFITLPEDHPIDAEDIASRGSESLEEVKEALAEINAVMVDVTNRALLGMIGGGE